MENAAAYAHHATETVFPALADLPGFRGAQLLQREIAGGIEFLVLTDWESLDAIRAFAGDDADTAVVEPTAGAILSEFDPSVIMSASTTRSFQDNDHSPSARPLRHAKRHRGRTCADFSLRARLTTKAVLIERGA